MYIISSRLFDNYVGEGQIGKVEMRENPLAWLRQQLLPSITVTQHTVTASLEPRIQPQVTRISLPDSR